VLRYVGIQGVAPFSLTAEDLTTGSNTVGILWTESSGRTLNLTDGTTLLEAQFQAIGAPGSFSAVQIGTQPFIGQFLNPNFDGLAFTTQPGSVTLDNTLRYAGAVFYADTSKAVPKLNVYALDSTPTVVTNGVFTIPIASGQTFTARVEINEATNSVGGVDVSDILALRRHVLGKKLFESGWQFAAADMDDNGRLDVVDVLRVIRVILDRTTAGWRFYGGSGLVLSNNYLSLPNSVVYPNYTTEQSQEIFRGVKKGDVTLDWVTKSADAKMLATPGGSISGSWHSGIGIVESASGGRFKIGLHLDGLKQIAGIQVALTAPAGAQDLLVEAPQLPGFSRANFVINNGVATVVWTSMEGFATSVVPGPLIMLSGHVVEACVGSLMASQDLTFDSKVIAENDMVYSLRFCSASLSQGIEFGTYDGMPDAESRVNVVVPAAGIYEILESSELNLWQRVADGYFPKGSFTLRINPSRERPAFFRLVPVPTSEQNAIR
jgi:hypothetical protein